MAEDPIAERIDHEQARANMFGIAPCPKCDSTQRWPSKPVHSKHPNCIICDDCGLVVKIKR